MMILLVADFVDTTIKGRDDLRSLGPPCYARTGGSAAGRFEGRNERFHMAFAVYGLDANRCHCQVLLRP